MQLVNIGFGNTTAASRIVAILAPNSSPIKQVISAAREVGKLIDATYGRRTRGVVILDSEHVILSAIEAETLGRRASADQLSK
jgi:extracellular matrix regulatory protein A